MSGYVMVKRELLEDLLDSARAEIDQRVASLGEDFRPHVLAALRATVAEAQAALDAPPLPPIE